MNYIKTEMREGCFICNSYNQFIVPMSDKHRRGRDNDLAVVVAISNLNYNNNIMV